MIDKKTGTPELIGKIDCPVCGEQMPVKLNGRDTLNTSCPWCGNSSYAKQGTQAHSIISGWLRSDGGAAISHGKPAAPIAPAAPAPLQALQTAAKTLLG